jgi:hypothetical protein
MWGVEVSPLFLKVSGQHHAAAALFSGEDTTTR